MKFRNEVRTISLCKVLQKSAKITMAEIKRTCHYLDDFASELFEMEA